MAHIVPWSARGPRGKDRLPDGELNDADNLILLCPDHHKEVDGNPGTYTVRALRGLKDRHERWVRVGLGWTQLTESEDGARKLLIVLAGAASTGKDVILNRLLPRLQRERVAINLQRFTTRASRPEESFSTPFTYCTQPSFFRRVARGIVSCVHSANNNYYGFDSHFGGKTPPGTVVLTCMRQFNYLAELKARATGAGLETYTVLLEADHDTLHDRILMRGVSDQEKAARIATLRDDVNWVKRNRESEVFDIRVTNSDSTPLRKAVDQVDAFIAQRLEGALNA